MKTDFTSIDMSRKTFYVGSRSGAVLSYPGFLRQHSLYDVTNDIYDEINDRV